MVLDEEIYQVGEPFAKYFNLTNDEVYEIGLTPNRTENKNRTKAQITHKKKTRNKNNVGKRREKKQQMKIITFKATNLKKPTN